MKANTLGVVVIGQTPRPDTEAMLRAVLGTELNIAMAGALDGVARSEIDTFLPHGSHDTLYTRLPGGAEVVISKAEVTKRTQRHFDRFAAEGIDVILMACTGTFEGLQPRGHVVFPSAVLTNLVKAILPKGRLGILVPLASQEEQARSKWAAVGDWDVAVEPLLPVDSTSELEPAARRLANFRSDLIVMDCMGYTQSMKERVRAITGIRTVLAVSAAARAVQELLV